jgi:Tfp pilus assembly protein PilV
VNITLYRGQKKTRIPSSRTAFTLLEVMVAVFLFFIAVFSILELMSQNLRLARSLQKNGPTAAMVAGRLALTNKLEDGVSYSGDFEGYYPEYSWTSTTMLAGTNGLFQVDIEVLKGNAPYSSMSILLYRPESPTSPFGGSTLGGRSGGLRQ